MRKLKITSTIVLGIILVTIGTLLLFQPATDPDFGWQYKYGEYIVKNHTILRENIFSYTYTDYSWANSYWVAQIIFYLFFSKLSLIFSLLFFSFVFSLALFIFINKLPEKNAFAKSTTFIITLLPILSYQIVVRPMYFSSLFLLGLIYVLLYKPKLIKYSPILFVIWANFHADFTLGLLIIAIYKFFEVLQLLRTRTLTLRVFVASSINFLLCLLATFINPYGINLWTTLLKETSHFFKLLSINEMLPVNIYNASIVEVIMLLLFPGIILSVAILIPVVNRILNRQTEFTIWYPVLLLVFFIWSIRSIYFVRILFLLGAPGLYYLINLYSTEIAKKFPISLVPQTQKLLKTGIIITVAMILMVSLETFATNLVYTLDSDYLCAKKKLPCMAVAKAKELKPKGNMINDYSWGGYFILNLPEYKTFIDGRMPSWKYNGNYLFEDYLKISKDFKNNQELFDDYVRKYNISWALLKSDAPLAKSLLETQNWEPLYKDDIAIILVKK